MGQYVKFDPNISHENQQWFEPHFRKVHDFGFSFKIQFFEFFHRVLSIVGFQTKRIMTL